MPADTDLQTRRSHQHCLHDEVLAFVVGKLHTRDGHQQGLHTIIDATVVPRCSCEGGSASNGEDHEQRI